MGDYTIYNDFVREPKDFEKNNVLYQYPVNQDKLIIGKFGYYSQQPQTLAVCGVRR